MAKKYDVVATIGKYEKDGQTKYVNRNVGAILSTDKGYKLVIDASFNPAGCSKDESGRVWLSLFEPNNNQQTTQPQTQNQASQQFQQPYQGGHDPLDEDVPF